MFHLCRFPSGACEIRFDFHDRHAEEIPPHERRVFIRLSSSLEVVNAWLAVLAADSNCAPGTVYEYAKALLYALEWLTQEPINIATREPVGHSLLSLNRNDLHSLFAWLDIPAKRSAERRYLVREGKLSAGHRKNAIAPSTRNLRNAALTRFYDWYLFEYSPGAGDMVELTGNPMRDMQRTRSYFPIENHSDGLLLGTARSKPEATSPFRRRRNEVGTGPLALTPGEVKLVLDSVPYVSYGCNAANRNGALIRLLLWGMLRKEELVEATWECVDGETLWITGKGGKRRAIPIADSSTWSYLHAYTNELSIPSGQRFHGPLLRQLDHEDRPITRHVVEHLLDALYEYFTAEAARRVRRNDSLGAHALNSLANKLHSHIFRATGATFMAKAGMNLIMLSLLLGHSNPSTTMRYYIEAKQLTLNEEVLRICRAIEAALKTAVPSASPHTMPNPRSWYQRRGLIQG